MIMSTKEHELIVASREGNFENVEILNNERPTNINEIRDEKGLTALHCSTFSGHHEVVELLCWSMELILNHVQINAIARLLLCFSLAPGKI